MQLKGEIPNSGVLMLPRLHIRLFSLLHMQPLLFLLHSYE